MKTRTLLITASVALVALLAVPLAFAQRGHMHGSGEPGAMMILGHLQHAKEALGLSDQQVSDIQAIFQSLRDQNATYHESLRGTIQQVAQTLINNPNDIATAQSLLDKQIDAERAMKTNALNAASKALNVLSPDQRAKLSQLLQEHFDQRRPK
jgi:Spy/CpxP family protein refolding chaperone